MAAAWSPIVRHPFQTREHLGSGTSDTVATTGTRRSGRPTRLPTPVSPSLSTGTRRIKRELWSISAGMAERRHRGRENWPLSGGQTWVETCWFANPGEMRRRVHKADGPAFDIDAVQHHT